MNYSIKVLPIFEKNIKKLSKKYPSLKTDFSLLISKLKTNPTEGVLLGNNCYKIRMAITSKGKGKSSGARIITHFVVSETTVFLLTIYDKSDKESISNKELKDLINEIF